MITYLRYSTEFEGADFSAFLPRAAIAIATVQSRLRNTHLSSPPSSLTTISFTYACAVRLTPGLSERRQ